MDDVKRITINTPIKYQDPLPEKVDVVIIGAGVIGMFAALYLVRLGKSVFVCEKGRVAGEQSSRKLDVRFDDFSIVKTDQRTTSKGKGERIVSVALNHADEMKAKDCGADRASDSIVDHRDIKTGNIGPYGLRTDVPPSENFDLADWKLTLPVDRDYDGKADEVSEADLAQGWSDPSFFYTDPVTGGLVFRVPQNASATTIKSGYPRTELREMLRAGDLSIDTRGSDGKANKNNWVLPSAPKTAKAQAGGVGGVLRATLAVNQVTRMGEPHRIGRVVIGQIHARDHEVLRLYYRKLPTNSLGSIYYAHDLDDDSEIYVEIIGDRGDFIPNPKEGIALDEVFSYEVRLEATCSRREAALDPSCRHYSRQRDEMGSETAGPHWEHLCQRKGISLLQGRSLLSETQVSLGKAMTAIK